MNKLIPICIMSMLLNPLRAQYFEKLGNGLSIKTFYHQQGINYYLHETDSSGMVYAIYYDTVTSSFNFGHEYTQIRLQIFDGTSWLLSKPIRLYNLYSIDAPRVLDIKYYNKEIYICGSFDSSQNNFGAGIIKFSGRDWQSCGANLSQSNPGYFEVNKAYAFQGRLLIAGNFDSIPGTKVNGLLMWNGSAWTPVGIAGQYGFRNLSGTSNVFFQVINDSLYAFNKNKITPDSIEIGGAVTHKLAVFNDGAFQQVKVPAPYIAALASFNKQLVVIPSSSLVYTSHLLLRSNSGWTDVIMPDSFYATSHAGTCNTGSITYFLFQSGDTKQMNVYAFDGVKTSRLQPFKIADNYLPVETKSIHDIMTISGNFRYGKKGSFTDSFTYIARLVFRPVSILTGIAFKDENNDGIKQVTEPVLPYCKVYSTDNKYFSLSDAGGRVNMVLPLNGNYSLNAIHDRGYTSAQTYMINNSADSIYQHDFGLISSGSNDMGVSVFSHTANKAKQGFETSYTVYLDNYSILNQSVQVQIKVNPRCSNFKYKLPLIKTPAGFTFNTNIDGKNQQSFRFSCVYAVDSFELDEKVFVVVSISSDDANKANNKDTAVQFVSAAFDPNIKAATPDIVSNVGKEIKYTIFFQNLGNDIATNVTVIDSFGSLFNLREVQYLDMGPGQAVVSTRYGNTLIWTFKNINLPPQKDDSENDIKSVGYVNLRSFMSKNAKIGDTIFNKASIYFDYQKPVITNNSRVIFVSNSSVGSQNSRFEFSIYPNPNNGYFRYKNPGHLQGELQLFSSDGKLVFSSQLSFDDEGEIRLPETLAKGIYILKIDGENQELGKIIVGE